MYFYNPAAIPATATTTVHLDTLGRSGGVPKSIEWTEEAKTGALDVNPESIKNGSNGRDLQNANDEIISRNGGLISDLIWIVHCYCPLSASVAEKGTKERNSI